MYALYTDMYTPAFTINFGHKKIKITVILPVLLACLEGRDGCVARLCVIRIILRSCHAKEKK